MFKLKKLECNLLHEMDRELLLIEIKGISEAKVHLDNITIATFSIIYGFITFIASHFELFSYLSGTNILIIPILTIVYIGLVIGYNKHYTSQLAKYEKELYDLAIKKGK